MVDSISGWVDWMTAAAGWTTYYGLVGGGDGFGEWLRVIGLVEIWSGDGSWICGGESS